MLLRGDALVNMYMYLISLSAFPLCLLELATLPLLNSETLKMHLLYALLHFTMFFRSVFLFNCKDTCARSRQHLTNSSCEPSDMKLVSETIESLASYPNIFTSLCMSGTRKSRYSYLVFFSSEPFKSRSNIDNYMPQL